MNPILLAVLLVAAIGITAGLILGIASKVFAVPVDEKAEVITEMLPGANCGGCGFSGCSGYAAALSAGTVTDTAKCVAADDDLSASIAEYLGLAAGKAEKSCAVVLCCGSADNAELKMEYKGEKTCRAANKLYGGEKMCEYGCIGFGDCIRACPFDAISVCGGVAVVNADRCKACGKCVAVCPKHIIEIMSAEKKAATVMCKNASKGNIAMKACKVSCIGCKKCEKTCEFGAVKVENNLAVTDRAKCTSCGKCVENCPKKCIHIR